MIRTEISERRLAFGRTSQLARFFFSKVLASIMASLCSAALIVPPLEGVLAGVMLVVFRALVRHVSEYAPSGPGRKPENGRLSSN